MSRGLHLLGYDWLKGASSMTAALAEGLAEGATKQRASDATQKVLPQAPLPPGLPSGTVVTDREVPSHEGEGWFSRRELWGLPNWQLAGGAGLLGGIVYVVVRALAKARLA